ncbi:MAG: membrane protein insertion efficiency factor YidD [Ruminococcus sp.]|nr:membrane protein insertion efficiency factor YidD [Ruminococcus sp.]MBO5382994.1 membrane protein insertion efficiency factor YidD [Ruminococcus sp.]MBR6670786.1 membrane protein insertion efficiency factor YidD [Ruminococcus sp.]
MKYIFILPIMFYRKVISPLFPAKCKYIPSCSTYALEAFRKFGAVRGLILTVYRLLRCNPWSLGGFDPVPEKFSLKIFKHH